MIELFKDAVPKTVENFRSLCTGKSGVGRLGKALHYKGSIFHRGKCKHLLKTLIGLEKLLCFQLQLNYNKSVVLDCYILQVLSASGCVTYSRF